jgi:hypothetical protein
MNTENTIPEEQLDPTEVRRQRCEPLVELMLKEMLDRNLLLGDRAYVEQMIKYHLSALFQNLVIGYVNETFNMLDESLEQAVKKANEITWGKPEHEVTLKDVDTKLKK